MRAVIVGIVMALSGVVNAQTHMPVVLQHSKQLVVVTTASWEASEGQLRQFVRSVPGQAWQEVGTPWPVKVGKHGLGWAADMHNDGLSGPIKTEGDKKAPAGAFSLTEAFGFAAAGSGVKLPYLAITPTLECVDDPQSRHYGRIVDGANIATKDWHSSERMHEHPEAYHRGIVVAYNTDGQLANAGSCIFMHISTPSSTDGTLGCTAMSPAQLNTLLDTLDPAAQPVLVQLPLSQYRRLQQLWELPKIT